jgi:hypothetical protein
MPKPGGGGTSGYIYTSYNASRLSHTSAAQSNAPANGATQLPATGGGAGGGSPTNPLAPLALLAAVAIVAGRLLPRILKK